ncbi:MAG: hypothetical protein JKX80_01175 [Candidatus Pacebacteria bacterium]|nr:hypothetical protein [Candidatus Paceibacterota bacterium]
MDETRNRNRNHLFFQAQAKKYLEPFGLELFKTRDEAIVFLDHCDDAIEILISNIEKSGSSRDLINSNTALPMASAIAEALRIVFDGRWIFSEAQNRWVVRIILENESIIDMNPFNKFEKRIQNGVEDAIDFYFKSMIRTIKEELNH